MMTHHNSTKEVNCLIIVFNHWIKVPAHTHRAESKGSWEEPTKTQTDESAAKIQKRSIFWQSRVQDGRCRCRRGYLQPLGSRHHPPCSNRRSCSTTRRWLSYQTLRWHWRTWLSDLQSAWILERDLNEWSTEKERSAPLDLAAQQHLGQF